MLFYILITGKFSSTEMLYFMKKKIPIKPSNELSSNKQEQTTENFSQNNFSLLSKPLEHTNNKTNINNTNNNNIEIEIDINRDINEN